MQKDSRDLKRTIRDLVKIMRENDLVELNIEQGDDRIAMKRSDPHANHAAINPYSMSGSVPPTQTTPEQDRSASEAKDEGLVEITSPIVGTFYHAPSPDSPPYVEVGTAVTPSTVVCIIEAMKVMNEIKAEVSGVVSVVLVNNGEAVEFGQPLFKVKPH